MISQNGLQRSIPAILGVFAAVFTQYALGYSLRGEEELLADETEMHRRNLEEQNEALFYLSYISIPIISGVVGFGTNWLALKMTFYPVEFFGIELLGKYSRIKDQPAGCIGWQGIVPTKAAKMADTSVELMTKEIFSVQEIFLRIDKTEASKHMKKGFETSIGDIIEEVSDKYVISSQTEWKRTEAAIKQQAINMALDALPQFTENFMGDLIENLDDVYDLKDMCVTEMVANRQLLNDIFENVGAKELIFIRNSGFYFGFLFGLVQLGVWIAFPYGIMLPIFGFLVGYATNWVALKMIFSPIEPRYINLCGLTTIKIQGLFLKRQKEASIAFARKIVGTVLHSENIWKHMLNGPKSDKFKELLDNHVDELTDSLVGQMRPIVVAYLGEENFQDMKDMVRNSAQEQIEGIIEFMHEYTDEALDLENEIGTKMGALPAAKFERVLHPVFEEDELKLIIVGAILGVLVGLFQAFVVFGNEPLLP